MSDLTQIHLVSTDWLGNHISEPDLLVVDGSTHLPTTGRNARAEYVAAHIPDALFFDINDIADPDDPLPHMLPSAALFAQKVQALGIGPNTAVVAYDTAGIYSAARVWWMLRTMGHDNVAVLNGGMKRWQAESRPVSDKMVTPQPASKPITPMFREGLVRSLADMKGIVASGTAQVMDARAGGRFRGEEPEPRAGLRAGHMPGATSMPFVNLLNDDGTMKPRDALQDIFVSADIDLSGAMVTSCGTGVTAAVIALALAELGREDVAVYDGSWSEWGHEDAGTEVVTGA